METTRKASRLKSDQAPTLVFLQNSRSLQHDSSTTTSGPRLGSMVTAPMEDVNTTRRTVPASAAALITYSVPRTAGSTICSCTHACSCYFTDRCVRTYVMVVAASKGAVEMRGEVTEDHVDRSGTHRVVGDGGGGVEDALAALHGAADGIVVQEVGLAEDQPLGGAVQRLEVRVLRVICRHRH